MKKIIRLRWPLLIVWLVITVVLAAMQPDINAILHERGQNALAADSPSVVANQLIKEITNTEGTSDLIAFFNKDGLSEADMKSIEVGITSLKEKQVELGFSNMMDPFSTPEAKSRLISEDNTTLLASFTLSLGDRTVEEVKEQFSKTLGTVDIPYYLTGEDFIQNDYVNGATASVEKSGILTIIFILVVLIIMFRSFVIPFVSLLTVGVAYLVSMGIAGLAIDKLNFPVTTLTQMIMILILFGIGTDYNILLFNRFKEELAQGKTTDDAIIDTYKTAGKTILFSISTVFIAFACLSFTDFEIYKSANVVAIGTIVLMLVILTLTPFVMKVLGTKLFWPSHNIGGHKESRLMGALASFSVKRPVITIVVIAALLVPVFLTGGQKLSFDQIRELGDDYSSTKGFSIVAEHFSRGMVLPTNIAIKGKGSLENNDAFGVIDKLTDSIKQIPGVESVASITQPEGKPIDNFYIRTQTGEISKGMSASKDGVTSVKDGLVKMQEGLTGADFSEVGKLADGTAQLENGYKKIASALNQVASGIGSGADGAKGLQAGIAELRAGLSQISAQTSQLSDGLSQIQQGYGSAQTGYDKLVVGLPGIESGLTSMNGLIDLLGQSHNELNKDTNYVTLKSTGAQLSTALASISSGFVSLLTNYEKLNTSFGSSAEGLKQLATAQQQIVSGLEKLEAGATELSKGLKQGSSGGKELAANLVKLNTGLGEIQNGQVQLNTGLSKMSGGMNELKDGLQKSSMGLGDISAGLGATGDFLKQFGTTNTFFIPSEALRDASFQKAEDAFMSKDRTATKIMVILDEDPYSPAAFDVIEKINETLDKGLEGTVLSATVHGAAGPTSTAYEMNKTQLSSFNTISVIVIIAVFLVLLLVIRSFWPTIFIVGSLLASYFVALSSVKFLAINILGMDGISSFVPFFAFVIIVSVGVDYSIFLMMRYKEYCEFDHREAITRASKSVGGVIISAMIILGGTFATLMPSGMILLVELSTAIIVGLFVLTFVFLPMLVPALMALQGALNDKIKKVAK